MQRRLPVLLEVFVKESLSKVDSRKMLSYNPRHIPLCLLIQADLLLAEDITQQAHQVSLLALHFQSQHSASTFSTPSLKNQLPQL